MTGWIDLSHSLETGMPMYPGDPEVSVTAVTSIAAEGYAVHSLQLGSHSGTHLDAPAHVVSGGRTIDQIAPAELMGEALVLRFDELAPSAEIGLADALPQLERAVANSGSLPPIVVIATGWDRYWGMQRYFEHPHLAPALAAHLLERGVRVLGVDTPSTDVHDGERLPVHEAVLGSDGLIIENLRGLTELPPRVEFLGLPLRLTGVDASPIRALARVSRG